MMYFIALCDDDERELDKIEDFLAAYQESKETDEYRIDRFRSAEELLERIAKKEYDGHLDFVTPFTAVNSLRF